MSYECFEVSVTDAVAHVRLNRPDKRNAMNRVFWDELPAIVRDIDENVKARVIVLSSTGPHFTAGLDVQDFMQPPPKGKAARVAGVDFYHETARMQDSFSALENCRIPVIAAVQGGAIGGGVDLLTACDLRYASADAYITIYEINVGMTADVGTFPRILNLLPEGVVRELAYTGRKMTAEEAAALGFFNAVLPDQAAAVDKALAVAREIATKPPLAVHGCKRAITYSRDHDTADSLERILLWNAHALQPEEMMESLAARTQNRAGDFADLPKIRNRVARD